MAIISCPFCGQKISDKATNCSKCQNDLSDLTPEKIESLNREKRFNQSQRLVNHSMMALVLFLGGFGIWYWWQPESGSYNQYIAAIAVVTGFVWYIVTRIRIMLFKRRKK
ncbi:zinc ribbon domain-containing protein [Chromatiaceae bacterium AAb-1]|nr:zinc ribbon domain-containing protein [Chromatiaceae bacterium AAb-1]